MNKEIPEQPAAAEAKPTGTRMRRFVACVLLIAAVALVAAGALRLYGRHQAVSGVAVTPDQSVVITEDVPEPAEAKPAPDEYMVAPDQPRSIAIQKFGISGLIQKIGLTPGNAIAVPTNIHFAGWYTGSAKPGEAGLSIIDGHVSGKYADGIFKQLSKVTAGDIIQVEYGDKSIVQFEAVETKTVPEAESAALLLHKREDIAQQLNLITCGGSFNKTEQIYENRIVVIARRL